MDLYLNSSWKLLSEMEKFWNCCLVEKSFEPHFQMDNSNRVFGIEKNQTHIWKKII